MNRRLKVLAASDQNEDITITMCRIAEYQSDRTSGENDGNSHNGESHRELMIIGSRRCASLDC